METLKVGIREFREKLASYLLETEVPVAITRHGDTIGYYIPARRKRSEAERTALKEVQTGQNSIPAESSFLQVGQMRWASVLMDLPVPRMRLKLRRAHGFPHRPFPDLTPCG